MADIEFTKLAALERMVRRLSSDSDLSEYSQLELLARDLAVQIGFEHMTYSLVYTAPLLEPTLHCHWGHPSGWADAYVSEDLVIEDPIVRYCIGTTTPMIWNWSRLECHAVRFAAIAKSFNINCGIAAPVHDCAGMVGILNLSSSHRLSENIEECTAQGLVTVLLANQIHRATMQRIGSALTKNVVQMLSRRERECLMWVARGKTAGEIARVIGVAERTVEFHVENSMQKLGARNRGHAVACALNGAFHTDAKRMSSATSHIVVS